MTFVINSDGITLSSLFLSKLIFFLPALWPVMQKQILRYSYLKLFFNFSSTILIPLFLFSVMRISSSFICALPTPLELIAANLTADWPIHSLKTCLGDILFIFYMQNYIKLCDSAFLSWRLKTQSLLGDRNYFVMRYISYFLTAHLV